MEAMKSVAAVPCCESWQGLISSGEIGVVEVPHSPSMPSGWKTRIQCHSATATSFADDRGKDVPEPAEDPMAPVHASDAFCHEAPPRFGLVQLV